MPSTASGEVSLWFEWEPDPLVLARLADETANALKDLVPPLVASMQIAREDIAQHFATKTGPDGSAWKPWADSYTSYGEANNVNGLLEQTDEMMGAVTSASAFDVTAHEVIFTGAGAPDRWLWHQHGASRSKGGELPARPFVGLDDAAQARVVEVFEMWFSECINFFVGASGIAHFRLPSGRIGPRVGL